MPRSALLNVMVSAVLKAGRTLTRDFGEVENLQVSMKGPANFVSAADRRAEEILHAELSKARPGWSFLMEESGAVAGTDPSHTWIIDPLDGTTNFLHGIPHFCISVGLKRDETLLAGVIFNPVSNELFTAERGGGAFLNERRRLRVASRRHLADSVVIMSVPRLGRGDLNLYLREARTVIPRVAGVRKSGAAALDLAYVAAGRCDAYWDRDLQPWDIAAGLLLVREAGGIVTTLANRDDILDRGTLLAANEDLHRDLMPLIREAEVERV